MANYDVIVSVKGDKYWMRILAGDRVHTGFWFNERERMVKFADDLRQAVALAPALPANTDE